MEADGGGGRDQKPDYDRRLWQLECGCGSCRLILRLTAYIVSAVVVMELTRSPQKILWWEEVEKPLSLLELLPVWDDLENKTNNGEIPPQAGRICFLISKAPLQWSEDDMDALEVNVNVFDTNAAVNLGAISGGTTRQDYCGFSLEEIVEASFMVGTIMDVEEADNSTNVDVRSCLTPLYCRRHRADLEDACVAHREDPSCYDSCYTEEYEWSLLLTLVNESESLPWTGSNETASSCEEREEFLNEIFFEVPKDRLKAGAFINLFRFEATKEALRYKTVGPFLTAAVGLTGILWVIQLANFLYHQYRVEDDNLRCAECLSRRMTTSTLILVTWLFPLAILRPLSRMHEMPEPLSDTMLMVTPSAYSDMLVGIVLIMVCAVPLMCCGGFCVAARCSCLAVCSWFLAWVLCTSAAALIGRSYWFDGFFLYVELSMVFSLNFTWEMSMLVDLIQLLFFVSFLLEVASVITFIARYVRKNIQRCWDYKGQLQERCSQVGLPVEVQQSEASTGKDIEEQRQDQTEQVCHPKQDVDPKDPCPEPQGEASNPDDDGNPEESCPDQQQEDEEIHAADTADHIEEDAAHHVVASNPDLMSL